MKHLELGGDLKALLLQTKKFKTNIVTILLRSPLERESATKKALLAGVLSMGTRMHPSKRLIEAECEKLYGALLSVDIIKKAEEHIIQIYFEILREQFAEKGIFDRAGELLHQIIFEPFASESSFAPDNFEIQKEQLRQRILGKINDKRKFALDRCIEIMCENEPFGVCGDGYIEDVSDITPETLFTFYADFIGNCKIDIGIIGEFSEEAAEIWALKHFSRELGEKTLTVNHNTFLRKESPVTVRESMNLAQGKLVLGYRSDILPVGSDFYAFLLFNTLAGGGANSRFFKKIREESSLCYYISSFLFRAKGFFMVQAGIDENDYEKTVSLIEKLLGEMAAGKISQTYIDTAKSALITQFETSVDSPQMLMDFYMSNSLVGDSVEIGDMRGIISGVAKEEIVNCAQRIYIDTSYFLA